MSYPKSKLKLVAVLAVVLVAVVAGYLIFNKSDGSSKPATTTSKESAYQAKTNPKITKPATVAAADFDYQKPAGWAKLAQDTLDLSTATSGIGQATKPGAQFTVKVSSSTPLNADDQKNSTLAQLKQLSSFELLASGDTNVDGKAGQIFTYTFSGTDKIKVKQQLGVVVYKQKTFFLLFSSADSDFGRLQPEFNQILTGFKFK